MLGPKDDIRTVEDGYIVGGLFATLKSAQANQTKLAVETAELYVTEAETRVKETKIYAPTDGTILEIPVEKGTIITSALTNVNGGTPVMTIADLTDLRIIGAIDEVQIGRVALQPVGRDPRRRLPGPGVRGSRRARQPLGKEAAQRGYLRRRDRRLGQELAAAPLGHERRRRRDRDERAERRVLCRRRGGRARRRRASCVSPTATGQRRIETGSTDGTELPWC